jgi:hypothetical protein
MQEGEPCSLESQLCGVHLACGSDGYCHYQKDIGQACDNNFECKNTAFCALDTKICTAYFSLEADSNVQAEGFSLECSSHYANSLLVCASPPASMADYSAVPCYSTQDCALTKSQYSSCECSFTESESMHCRKAYGDPVWDQVATKYKEILEYNYDCETEDRFSEECPEITSLVQYTADLISFATFGHLFYNSSACSRGVLAPFFRSEFESIALLDSEAVFEEEEIDALLNEGGFSGSSAGLIVIVVLVSLCMLFLCAYGSYRLYKTFKEHARMKMESLEKHKEEIEASDHQQNDQFLGNVNLSLYNNDPVLSDFQDQEEEAQKAPSKGNAESSGQAMAPSAILNKTALSFAARREMGHSGVNFAERIAQNKTGMGLHFNLTSSWNTGTKTEGFRPRTQENPEEELPEREEGRQLAQETTLNESSMLNESSLFIGSGEQPPKIIN